MISYTLICAKKKSKKEFVLGDTFFFLAFSLLIANVNESLKIINKKSKLQLPVPITAYSFVSRSGHLGLHNTSLMAKRNGLFRHYLYSVLLLRLELFSDYRGLDLIKRHYSLRVIFSLSLM